MARIKGFAVRGVLKYVKLSGHPGGVAAVIAALRTGTASHFEKPILSSAWYPYEAMAVLVEAVDEVLGDGRLTIMPAIGRDGAVREAGTVFRIATTFVSTKSLVRAAPFFWSQTCDTGQMRVVDAREGRVLLELQGFPGVAEGHCHMIEGWLEGMTGATGIKDPRAAKTACVHRGDDHCAYEFCWGGERH